MPIHTPRTRADLAKLLAPLRLVDTVFERAVAVGAADSRTFSPGAPKSGPEITRWLRTVEAVHEGLMLLRAGWLRLDPQNLPYFLHPEARLGVIVTSGDEYTGSLFGSPATRNPKGSAFARRVDESGKVAMFGQPTEGGEADVDDSWIFLYDEREGLVHLELSCPMAMAGKQVDGWSERIIFPAFDVSLGALMFDEGDDEGEFGFTVARR